MSRSKINCESSSKTIGNSSWIPQPGYPKITRSYENISVEMHYASNKESLFSLPMLYSSFRYDDIEDIVYGLSYCRLREINIEPYLGDNSIYIIKLKYQTGEDFAQDQDEEPAIVENTLNSNDVDIPLEQHENYLAKWNHELWGYPENAPIPQAYDTTKQPLWDQIPKEQPASTSSPLYRMVKAGSKPDCDWMVRLLPVKKPGVEAYRNGVRTVSEIRRSRSLKKALTSIGGDYACASPNETYGLAGGQWLKGGSSITKNGEFWEVTTEYTFAPNGWDKDLYVGGTGGENA